MVPHHRRRAEGDVLHLRHRALRLPGGDGGRHAGPACRWRARAARSAARLPALPGRDPRLGGRGGARPRARCRPALPPFPTLLAYWSAPRPFNLGADWSAGTLLLLYVARARVPLRRADVPDGPVLRRAAARGARRRAHERPQGRLPAGLQHRGLRRGHAGRRPRRARLVGHDGNAARADDRRPRVRGRDGAAPPARAWDTVALGAALVALAVVLPGQRALWLRLHGDVGGDAHGRGGRDGHGGDDPRRRALEPVGERAHQQLAALRRLPHPARAPRPRSCTRRRARWRSSASGRATPRGRRAAAARPSRVTVYEICAPQIALLQRLARSPEPPPRLRRPSCRTRASAPWSRTAATRSRRSDPRFDVIEMDALFPSSPFSGQPLFGRVLPPVRAAACARAASCARGRRSRACTATFMAAFPHVVEMRQGQLLVGSQRAHRLSTSRRGRPAPRRRRWCPTWARTTRASSRTRWPPRAPRSAAAVGARDLNHDLFPRDEFKVGSDEPVTAGSPVASFRSTKHFR